MTDRNLSPAKKSFDKTSWHMLRLWSFLLLENSIRQRTTTTDPPPVSVKCMMMAKNDKGEVSSPEKKGATTHQCFFYLADYQRSRNDGTFRYFTIVHNETFLKMTKLRIEI